MNPIVSLNELPDLDPVDVAIASFDANGDLGGIFDVLVFRGHRVRRDPSVGEGCGFRYIDVELDEVATGEKAVELWESLGDVEQDKLLDMAQDCMDDEAGKTSLRRTEDIAWARAA